MFFVKLSSMVKNRIRTLIDRYPELKKEFNQDELFGKHGKEWLSLVSVTENDRRLLDNELELLEYLEGKVKESNGWLEQLGANDERVKFLMTIPGIGNFFALLIAVEIDKIERFRNKDKLAAYCGLMPSVYSSGGKTYMGKIANCGNKYLRWALIEAVWPAIRKDLGLQVLYHKLKEHKNTNIAKVAVTRKLSAICYNVLSQKRAYITNYSGRPDIILTKA